MYGRYQVLRNMRLGLASIESFSGVIAEQAVL